MTLAVSLGGGRVQGALKEADVVPRSQMGAAGGGPHGSWWGPRSQLDSDGPDLGMLRSCIWQSRGQPGQVAMETLSVCFLSEQGWPGADQIALGFTGMKVEPSCPK